MTIKIRNSSNIWDTANQVHAYDGTAWKKCKRVLVYDGTNWQEKHRSLTTVTIDVDTNQVDLATLLTTAEKFYDVEVIINSDVIIYSNNATEPALKTGEASDYTTGATLKIINNGNIYGAGGTGGNGGSASSGNGFDGDAGGTALHLETNITLTDSGSILGGGGGGGGGAGANDNQSTSSHDYAGGGGGGGGQSFGTGGIRNSTCSGSGCISPSVDGTIGTLTTAGDGGAGAVAGEGSKRASAGSGGTGGTIGNSGSNGNVGSVNNDWNGGVGIGGVAGTSIENVYDATTNPTGFTYQ